MATTESDHQLDRTALAIGRQVQEASWQEDAMPAFSQRKREVLRELAKGQSNKQIGKALKISPETVHHHLKAIYLKLDVSTREEAVMEARRRAIIC